MKIGVIGAGLGGLLSALSLRELGHEVTIIEKLALPGGRFRNLPYKGFQLSTGALHMIPHGNRGPLSKMLRELGIDIDMVEEPLYGSFRIRGRDYFIGEIPGLFSPKEKLMVTKLIAGLMFGKGGDESYAAWVRKRTKSELSHAIAESFCGWSFGVSPEDISSRELISITKNVTRVGPPGVPIGGCSSVTNALVQRLESSGVEILYDSPVDSILIEDGKAAGLATKEDNFDADIVISNIGPKATIALCGERNFEKDYLNSIRDLKEASGIKFSISSDKSMIGHAGVLLTPGMRRIDGANQVTNADPTLAPKGKHLIMTHQRLRSENIKKEIELGMEDLHDLFPGFEKHCELLMTQTFKGKWPVNRARSGQHLDPKTPIQGLYNVGDAIKPEGWVETEGIAKGVELMLSGI